MALSIVGGTFCPLCSQTVDSSKEAYCFPAFVCNANDPMDFFNDSCFHAQCLAENHEAERAKYYVSVMREKLKPGNIVCDVSGKRITDPDSFVFLGLLTSDEHEELNRYNFLVVDKDSISNWKEREEFLRCVILYKSSGNWKDRFGDYLGWIISTLG